MARGLGAFLVVTYGVLAGWEFLANGTALELPDRFVQVELGMAPVAGAVVAYLLGRFDGRRRWTVMAVTVAASILPLLAVYGWSGARTGLGGTGLAVALALMTMAVVAAAAARWSRRAAAPAAVAATLLLVFGTNYALAASNETEKWFRESGEVYVIVPGVHGGSHGVREARTLELKSSEANRSAFELGMKLIDYLQSSGFQAEQPYFWYDLSAAPYYQALVSLYYSSYSYVGNAMPESDADFRYRMALYKPEELILLCKTDGCDGAPSVLASRGYAYSPVATKLIVAGREKVWVRVLRSSS